MKALINIITALVVVFAFSSTAAAQSQPAEQVVTIQIQGMSTPSCPVLVRKAWDQEKGVTRVTADLKSYTATVTIRQGEITPNKLLALIKDRVGFDGKVVFREDA